MNTTLEMCWADPINWHRGKSGNVQKEHSQLKQRRSYLYCIRLCFVHHSLLMLQLPSLQVVQCFSAHPSEKLWCVNVKTMIWASGWLPQSSDSEANSTLIISKEQHTKRPCRLEASVTEHHFHQLKWQTAAVAGRASCRQLTLIPRVTW